jgi:hypothetical protein
MESYNNKIQIVLLDLFVVLDLDLGSILIDNSFFFVSQKMDLNIIYILFVQM